MAACLYGNSCFLHVSQGLYINFGGSNQCLAQGGAQLVIICAQAFLCEFLLKHLAHQGEAVGVDAGGGQGDDDIAGLHGLVIEDLFLVYNAHGEAGQIVLVLRHHARVLSGLAAHQRAVGLDAALGHALDDLGDLLGDVAAAGLPGFYDGLKTLFFRSAVGISLPNKPL